ncbi:MAG: flagellar hook capping FlgD N-terminal domain-containing protein [Planctomycetota bacterium]
MDTQAAISAASAIQASDREFAFGNSELNTGDFLKLMIEELINQDPLDPVKNQELLEQVSNIRNMETLSNLDETLAGMTFNQQVTTGAALIGKTVTGVSTGGGYVTGRVSSVIAGQSTGVLLVTVAGDEISVDMVTAIEEGV